MAYDPQSNPLDALSSELKKRQIKNAAKPNTTLGDQTIDYRNLAAAGANPSQSLLNVNKGQQSAMPEAGNEGLVGKPTQPGYSVGYDFGKAWQNLKGMLGNIPGKVAQIPGEIASIPERAAAIKGGPLTYNFNKAANNLAETPDRVSQAIADAPGQIVDIVQGVKPPQERGLTLEERQKIVADVMAGEQKRIEDNKTLDERMVDMGLRTRSFNPNQPKSAEPQPVAIPVANAQPVAQPTQPTLSTQQQAQDKARVLRQQIAIEQKNMLTDRRARGGMYGDAGDAEALKKIQGLRNELNQYEQAGQSVQQAQTPEQYAERAQQFASSAATEVGNQIQKELTAASYFPEGSPQREAANARIQKMQEYVRQQQASAEKPINIEQATAATQRQQAMAEENMRRRAMDLTEAQKTTAKRELGEQREKDVAAAEQQANLDAINAPGREADARNKERLAGIAKTEAETQKAIAETGQIKALTDATIGNTKYQQELGKRQLEAADSANKYNRIKLDAQMRGAALTPEEKAQQDLALQNVNTKLGTTSQDEAAVISAVDEVTKGLGGASGSKYQGKGLTGSASGDIVRVNQINSYASGLRLKMEKGPPFSEEAATQARRLLTKMQTMTGTGASTETALEATGAGAVGGGAVGAGLGLVGGPLAALTVPAGAIGGAITGGVIGLGTHLVGSLGLNDADQQKVMAMWNQTITDLQTVANSGSQQSQQTATQPAPAKQ